MGEFHDRLIERARALGAEHVRIEHGGGRGSARRFRRHPHLTGEINGKPFKFPLKSRPVDASAGYRHVYLKKLETYLRTLAGLPQKEPKVAKPARRTAPPKRWRPTQASDVLASLPALVRAPTRLDRDPWAVLSNLFVTDLSAAESPAATFVEKETSMTNTNDNTNGPYVVVAQIGAPIRETGDYVEMDTIVMAERATEEEAERERDRRNGLNDGRWYFVMRSDEYDQAA